MGRMKDIFIDLMEEHGTIPENFDIDQYQLKKELAEYEEKEILDKLKEKNNEKEN